MESPICVLVVDDEPLIRLNLRALLEDLGYRVAEAGDGAQALERFADGAPDLVLTDLVMPVMGGMELIRELKTLSPFTPVVVVSGTGSIPEAISAVQQGAWDYVTKPVAEAETLELTFRRALERAAMMIENRNYQSKLEEMVKDRTRELAASEARYRRMLESVTGYVYTVTFRDGRPAATLHRPGCEAVTGFTADDYAADSELWFSMVCEEDRALVLECAHRIVVEPVPVSYECRIRHKSGELRWIENTLVPTCSPRGEILAYDGIVNDITERKLAQAAQLRSERSFRELLENVQLLAVILDGSGRIVFCNEFLAELTGWRRDELVGSLWSERFLNAEERPRWQEALGRVLASGRKTLHSEQRILTRDGRELVVVCDHTLMHDSAQVSGIATIGVDVTAHRQLEEELRHSQKMEAIGFLAGCVAHDFNNILTIVLTCAVLLQDLLPADDPGAGYVEQIKSSAERATHLTRSLLAFSRKQPMTMQTADLNLIVRELEDFLSMILGSRSELRLSCSGEPLPAVVDRFQIEQALMNLVANAKDAMPKGGVLSVRTSLLNLDDSFVESRGCGTPGLWVAVCVADTGTGMSEETRKRIFEPYFTTKEEGKGTGLGLSIVYGIVKQHNGFLEVQSEPGKGSCFHILLPAPEGVAPPDGVQPVGAQSWLAQPLPGPA